MELISQHTKKIMEGCKERARQAGLRFQDESLEYIVTNRDLLELTPKVMIPTLYDYWVHDVEVLKEKGKYELYPSNPYETVINTRPPISFYNDNNPDWLNVMIFYHVLAHIDFFQNNIYFRHTWDYDFTGRALSDKRVIARLRAEKGRWVDYIIEFSRGIDNLVAYHDELARMNRSNSEADSQLIDFYFDVFLQKIKAVKTIEYINEIERYNQCIKESGDLGEKNFFSEINKKYPEFETLFQKHLATKTDDRTYLFPFILEHSAFLNKEKNKWMKIITEIVRKTSLFFQPQIRTKIMNEGWASYWHEALFLQDDRIKGHEVDFARVNAWVTSLPRVGLNPYALGMRLFTYIEQMADQGKYSFEFNQLLDAEKRKKYDTQTGLGKQYIFDIRENFSDFMFINNFIDQDFTTKHKLFVAGKRLNKSKMVWEYYIKSRKAEDYQQMILDSLYHPPSIRVDVNKTNDKSLYLVHHFEHKPLIKDYIANTMIGIEYLWGGPVHLETSEATVVADSSQGKSQGFLFFPWFQSEKEEGNREIKWKRVVYTMENRKLSRKIL